MISRLGLSSVLLLALAGSLFLKFPGVTTIALGTPSTITTDVARVLEDHAFSVTQKTPDLDLQWVSGQSRACKVMVAPVAPQGWHQSLVSQLADGNQLYYLFQGGMYAEQPIVRTRAYYYWVKLNRYLGLNQSDRIVLAVIAASGCEALPLPELADLTAR